MTHVNKLFWMCMHETFHDGSNETIHGHFRLLRPEISSIWLYSKQFLWSHGPLIMVCDYGWDFLCGSSDTMAVMSDPGGRRYCCLLWRCSFSCHTVCSFWRKNRPLLSQQFIAGVVDTGKNCFLQCHWYQSEITRNIKYIPRVSLMVFIEQSAA